MLYLASQFAWFLLAAFALGWIMGWLGSARRIQLTSGPLPYLAGIWLLLAALTWLQGVNGAAALWVETALLYLAAYLAGCILASVVRAAAVPKVTELALAGAPAGMTIVAERSELHVGTKPPEPATAATVAAAAADETKPAPAANIGPVAKPARKKGGGSSSKDKPADCEP